MTLIKSISGIRGTIGGRSGDGLSPLDIVKFTAAYATFLKNTLKKDFLRVIVGRDARISGPMVSNLVVNTLNSMGADVIDLGLSTTPTVEIAVTETSSDGGIIVTASHNPKQWNALKLLNNNGEFFSEADGKAVLEITEEGNYIFVPVEKLGKYSFDGSFIMKHIEKILELPLVDPAAIKKARFRIVVDAVNSSGGIAVPMLLKALGVAKVDELNCDATGHFAHNPEPLPEHLSDLARLVVENNADLGISVDPDVDRLAFVAETGEMFGEEYTLVAVADFILKHQVGNTVSNLSSTRALKDITLKAGGAYFASAVGEVKVVEMMKAKNAIVGGEGNGGVIYPELHFGRDALVGIALFLTHLARSGKKCSALRDLYPNYYMSKSKVELFPDMDIDNILSGIIEKYKKQPVNTTDGVRIEFDKEWVHLRRSNTEAIIRIYAESDAPVKAEHLTNKIISDIRELIKN